MPTKITGAGVQPVAFYKDKIYFLLGQERYDKGWVDSNKYASFGGKREKGESILDAAVREGYEEGMGFLGSETDLRKQLKNDLIGTVEEYGHRTYIYEIAYDPDLPKQFKDVYQYTQRCGRKQLDKICPHGLFEKKTVKWMPADELAKLVYTDWKTIGQKILRWTFAMTVGQLISQIRKYQHKKKVILEKKNPTKPKKRPKKSKKRPKKSKKGRRKAKKGHRKAKRHSKKARRKKK